MNKFNLLLLVAALYLTGCASTARIALTNSAWQNNAGYPVEGRIQTVFNKKPLRFGEFHTLNVQTSWKRSSSYATDLDGRAVHRNYNTVGMLYDKSHSSRRFILSDSAGHASEVYTFNKLNTANLSLGRGTELNIDWLQKMLGMQSNRENSYYVQVFEPGTSKPWELVLDIDAAGLNAKNYVGYFGLNDDEYFTIKPVTKMMGKNGPMSIPIGVVGYEISDPDGKAVAAVSLFDKGMVYLAADLSKADRFLMANLCAALLLYDQEG
jgi:hypothetical protein